MLLTQKGANFFERFSPQFRTNRYQTCTPKSRMMQILFFTLESGVQALNGLQLWKMQECKKLLGSDPSRSNFFKTSLEPIYTSKENYEVSGQRSWTFKSGGAIFQKLAIFKDFPNFQAFFPKTRGGMHHLNPLWLRHFIIKP